ncbi:Pre-mRNA cleavage complex 2 protein Pcf11, partial [Orchesella cincta]
ISEASAMREVQQMQQIKGGAWQSTATNAIPNPWMTETDENNIWSVCPAPPRPGPIDFPSTARFPGPNTWEPSGDLPWMAANMPTAPRGPNPFEEAIGAPAAPTMVDDLVPKAIEKDIRVAERDVGRPIPIDGIMRQVRYYRETAIVMMGKMSDDPRELTFQKDNTSRVVLINGKRLEVYLGETKKFDINRMPHTLKIGSPGRELYIDDRPHEMYFGGPPKKIFLEGRPHSFQLISQAPQVSVGQVPRYDLVAGRVNLTIDAVSNVPVYLDEKLQKIDVFGVPVLLRFCSNFQTVTLNGRPFPTNFGARLPFTITLHGSGKHYFRFSAITPNLENAIHAFISANYGGDWNERNSHFGPGRGRGGVFRGAAGVRGRGRPPRDMLVDNRSAGPNPWAPEAISENQESSSSNVNPLDLLNNLFNTSDTKNNAEPMHASEQRPSENDQEGESETTGEESSGVNLNVSDLVANLIKFGLLPAAASSKTPESSSVEPAPGNDAEGEEEKMNEESTGETQSSTQGKEVQEKEKEKPEEPAAPIIPPLPTVDVTFEDNLKEKRNVAIAQIFTGVQCSQCGLRFPPDQTLRYSQHLDWHFRQNRREKANARKALSRKWYYDMSDWIQFEEIEDLEERAASLFENQETENDNDVNSPSALLNNEDYTVLASSHEGTACPQCGEAFESYFDEEREEWRLRNAKLDDCDGDKKLYHPNCYEDYLKSLVEESIVEDQEEEQQEAEAEPMKTTEEEENVPKLDEDDDEVLIIKEGKKEVVVMEIDIDDDVEKNDTVNEIVNEENHSIDMERKTDNVLIEKDDDIQTDGATSVIDNALDNTRNDSVQSPILIDEDSTFLPGLSDNAEGCVFGFARNTEAAQREIRMEQDLDTKIIYTPMKFDIPPIKIEPPDEEPVPEETTNPDEWLSNFQPYLSSSARSPGGSEPMNVDLTEEDSTDAVDSGASRLVNQIITSIDGNLQHEESATLPFIPAAKIRINIFGMDTTPCNSPKDKDKVDSPVLSRADESTPSQEEEALVKDNGNENNIISNNMEMNKDNPVDPVLTEEVKRLKPRLVGTKLTNCPPKFTGTEESGLCVIC